jgi:hypothetical protein
LQGDHHSENTTLHDTELVKTTVSNAHRAWSISEVEARLVEMSNVEAKDDRLLDTAYMKRRQLQSILLLDHSNGKKETHVSTEQIRNKHIRKK